MRDGMIPSLDMRNSTNELSVLEAVTNHYLETGKWATASEIAGYLNWTLPRTRRVLQEAGGAVQFTEARQESRPSYSKNYPGMESGSHQVWTYAPSRETLRQLILNERKNRQ